MSERKEPAMHGAEGTACQVEGTEGALPLLHLRTSKEAMWLAQVEGPGEGSELGFITKPRADHTEPFSPGNPLGFHA